LINNFDKNSIKDIALSNPNIILDRLLTNQSSEITTAVASAILGEERSTGFFALESILGEKIHASANVKKNTTRLSAHTTTLTQLKGVAIPPLS
jgi:hypothetical protein